MGRLNRYSLFILSVVSISASASASNDMSLILSGAVQKSEFSSSENSSKTDGFSSLMGLSKKVQDWNFIGLLGYSSLDSDFSSQNKDVNTDVNTICV
jgi:hypothetical protein